MTSPLGSEGSATRGGREQGFSVELVGWRDRRGKLDQAAKQGIAALNYEMFTLLMELRDAAIVEAPVGTGPLRGRKRYRDSFKVQTKRGPTGASGDLWNAAKHADYVIFPTRPHIIEPKNKRALHWKGLNYNVPQANRQGCARRQSQFLHHFARRVHHPGTKGNDVLGRVWQQHRGRVEEALSRAVENTRENVVNVFRDRPVKEWPFPHTS